MIDPGKLLHVLALAETHLPQPDRHIVWELAAYVADLQAQVAAERARIDWIMQHWTEARR